MVSVNFSQKHKSLKIRCKKKDRNEIKDVWTSLMSLHVSWCEINSVL